MPAVHLDYVGHAALTHRLLDADPGWTWEPMSVGPEGLPALDGYGGMWIRLTVCGVTRLGYGHAGEKQGGDAIKEVIGDALRNAAMRFGAALDLWHKGDLHADEEPTPKTTGVPRLEQRFPGAVEVALNDSEPLEPERKAAIDDLAAKIIANFPKLGPRKAGLFIEEEELGDVGMLYLSTKLPRPMQLAITKADRERHAEAKVDA